MATKLAKLLQLQVLASPGASPRPRRLVLWRDNHPDTGTASAVRRKSRPVLVCHWRPHSADGRLECRWRLESHEGGSDETPGENSTLSETHPRRCATFPRRCSICGHMTTGNPKFLSSARNVIFWELVIR
jgi:hypothetical protein